MKIFLALLLVGTSSVHAAEGFGPRKAVVAMPRTIPPAISVPASMVKVTVQGSDAEIEPLRRHAESAVARDPRFANATGPEVELAFVVQSVTVEKATRATSKDKDQWSLPSYTISTESTVPASNMPGFYQGRGIVGAIRGAYRITDAHGRFHGGGRFEETFDDWSRDPSEERVRAQLLHRAAYGVAGAMLRKHDSVPVLLPRGSFESLIPLAEAGQWDRYLAAVEAMPPMNTIADEAYRQYALGIAKEAVAYTADRDRALALLREAVEHYLSAVEENPNEPLFREPETFGETTVLPPLKRVTTSAKAYAAWRP